MKALDLTRTAAALKAYDEAYEAFRTGPVTVTLEEMSAAVELLDSLGAAVGEAYAADTADRNASFLARLIRPGNPNPPGGEADWSFIRRMVKQWEAS